MDTPTPEAIFLRARELADTAERERYLQEACQGAPDLRNSVDQLLAAAARADAYFGMSDGKATSPWLGPPSASPESPGSVIGPYRIEEQLGEGGMGVVYRAVQTESLRREVALKVVKPGMDTRQVIARFEAERQALALMDHPGIARVFDAGTTTSGRPFFVMELVTGARLTEHCDRHRLPIPARLELFIQVCHAVEHAHQKGIIHRDLKPSNILVTPPSETAPLGSPRIIDFGIAKAIQGWAEGNATLTTQPGFLGTPAYMSPEQALHGGRDVDTRTDVYSLGVVLYELLTGSTPFDSKQTREGGLLALERALQELEPVKPSTRITRMAEPEAASVADVRSAAPSRLGDALRGDLDWIVLKCLEKDRNRRYASVSALVSDLRHHLACEPVSARPPSTAYRLDRWVRRNRLLVASGALVLVSLIAGLGLASWQFLRAREARKLAEVEAQRAREEAAHNRQVSEFLESMLLSVGPSHAQGRDTQLLRDIMATATEKFRLSFSNTPASEAKLRATFAKVYADLGDFTNAVALNRESARLYLESIGPDHPHRLAVLNNLAADLQSLGRNGESLAILQECLKAQRRRTDHDPLNLAIATANVAILQLDLGELEEARAGLTEARRLLGELTNPEPGFLAALIDRDALILSKQSRFAEAEATFRDALIRVRAARGERHPEYAGALNNLGNALVPLGRLEEALTTLDQAVALKRTLLGPDHPSLLGSLLTRGGVLLQAGRLSQAESDFREILSLFSGPIGSQVPQMRRDTVDALVSVLLRSRRFDEALELLLDPAPTDAPPHPPLVRAQLSARAGRWLEAPAAYESLVHAASPAPDPATLAEWGLVLLAAPTPASTSLPAWRRAAEQGLPSNAPPASARAFALACLADPASSASLQNTLDAWVEAGDEVGFLPMLRLLRALAALRHGNPTAAAEQASRLFGTLGLDPALAVLTLRVQALAELHRGQPQEASRLHQEADRLESNRLPSAATGDWGTDWRYRFAAVALRTQFEQRFNPGK